MATQGTTSETQAVDQCGAFIATQDTASGTLYVWRYRRRELSQPTCGAFIATQDTASETLREQRHWRRELNGPTYGAFTAVLIS